MAPSSSPTSLRETYPEVYDAETEAIRDRRRVAGFGRAEADQTEADDAPPKNLVGAALSGGGLRSAMFSLGVVQAFSHRGLLRYADYLSSVSGGGFTAGHVAAEADRGNVPIGPPRPFHSADRADFGVDRRTGRLRSGYRFRNAGAYLDDFGCWLGHYLRGAVWPLALAVAGLGTFGVLIALLWRSLDHQVLRAAFRALGLVEYGGELLYAFLPALLWLLGGACGLLCLRRMGAGWARVCGGLGLAVAGVGWLSGWPWVGTFDLGKDALFWEESFQRSDVFGLTPSCLGALWLACVPAAWLLGWLVGEIVRWAVPRGGDRGWAAAPGTMAKWLSRYGWGAIFCATASLCVFLGNGFSNIDPAHGDAEGRTYLNTIAGTVAAATGALQLISLLGRGSLAGSERPGASPLRRYAARGLTAAACVAPVFLAVHLTARENISGYADRRDPHLLVEDVTDWQAFLGLFSAARGKEDGPAERGPLAELFPAGAETLPLAAVAESVRSADREARHARERIEGDTGQRVWESRPFASPAALAKKFDAYFGGDLYDYLDAWRVERERRGVFLGLVNPRLAGSAATETLGDLVERRADDEDRLRPELEQTWTPGTGELTETASLKQKLGGSDPALETRRLVDEWVRTRAADLREGATFVRLWRRWRLHGAARRLPRAADREEGLALERPEIRQLNRLLLEALFPNVIRERTEPSTTYLHAVDTETRLGYLLAFGLPFLLLVGTMNLNRVGGSSFRFYRQAVRRAFLDPADPGRGRGGAARGDGALHELEPWRAGAPYPLYQTALMLGRRSAAGEESGRRPRSRPALMTLAPRYSGGPEVGYAETADYCPGMNQDDAVTISASAINGGRGENPALNALLKAFDLNLGRWLSNPRGTPAANDSAGFLLLAVAGAVAGTLTVAAVFIGMLLGTRAGLQFWADGRFPAAPDFWRCCMAALICGAATVGLVTACGRREGGPAIWRGENWKTIGPRLTAGLAAPTFAFGAVAYGTGASAGWYWSAASVFAPAWLVLRNAKPGWPAATVLRTARAVERGARQDLAEQDGAGETWDLAMAADGGFRGYFGVEPLLERRCQLIVATDAACGRHSPDHITALGDLVRTAKNDHGIDLLELDDDRPLCPRRLEAGDGTGEDSPQQLLACRIRYPAGDATGDAPGEPTGDGLLIFVRMALTGREPADIRAARARYPSFPDEPTGNQSYKPDQTEAYRRLGAHVGGLLCAELPADRTTNLSFEELERRLRLAYAWECHRETEHSDRDVDTRALFVEPAADATVANLDESAAPERWLAAYEDDPDFRGAVRARVTASRRLTAGRWDELNHENVDAAVKATAERSGRIPPGLAAVVAVACRELLDRPKDPGGRRYQVGGRGRLLAAASRERAVRDFGAVVRGLRGGTDLWEVEPGEAALPVARWLTETDTEAEREAAVVWWRTYALPHRQFLRQVAAGVFTSGGPETATWCGWCLANWDVDDPLPGAPAAVEQAAPAR